MAKLYAYNLHSWILNGKWREILSNLPISRQTRALSCRSVADSARIAGAGILLQWALLQEGIPKSSQILTENRWGKPQLADFSAPQFSLSHSGDWVICAVGSQPLGADVELPRCTMQMARRFFHPSEVKYLETLSALKQKIALCRLWTAKEAFLKALGHGFATAPNCFYVDLTEQDAFLHQNLLPFPYRLFEYQLADYRVCLCSTEESEDSPHLHILTPKDF